MAALTKRIMRKLICFHCGKYLSLIPIKLTNLGFPVCARCPDIEADVCDQLTELMKTLQFPCSNDRYGCKKIVRCNTVAKHEKNCRFSEQEDASTGGYRFKNVFNVLTCDNCKCILNVAPIYRLENSTLICGRCEPLTGGDGDTTNNPNRNRQRYLENFTKTLPVFPCRYAANGCKILLQYETVTQHETNCCIKPMQCPSYEDTECTWNGIVKELKHHLQKKHKDMFLATPALLQLDLTQDCETSKILTFERTLFLLRLKVNVQEQSVKTTVCFLGDSRLVGNYKFRAFFKRPNFEEEMATKVSNASGNYVSYSSESETATVSLAALKGTFHDLSAINSYIDIVHNVLYVPCKWDNCDLIDTKETVLHHETSCFFATICKWNRCSVRGTPKEIETHQITCKFRKILCGYSECDAIVHHDFICLHRYKCQYRTGAMWICYVNGCEFTGTIIELREHLKKKHPDLTILNGNNVTFNVAKNSDVNALYLMYDLRLFGIATRFRNEVLKLYPCNRSLHYETDRYMFTVKCTNGRQELIKNHYINNDWIEIRENDITPFLTKDGVSLQVTIEEV